MELMFWVDGITVDIIGVDSEPLRERPAAIYDRERAMACSLARDCLIGACEHALFELLSGMGKARSSEEIRVGLLAAGMIREEINRWRETFAASGPVGVNHGVGTEPRSFTERSPALTTR
jgi:hypothetical protein